MRRDPTLLSGWRVSPGAPGCHRVRGEGLAWSDRCSGLLFCGLVHRRLLDVAEGREHLEGLRIWDSGVVDLDRGEVTASETLHDRCHLLGHLRLRRPLETDPLRGISSDLPDLSGAGEIWQVAGDASERVRLQGAPQSEMAQKMAPIMEGLRGGDLAPIKVNDTRIPDPETFQMLTTLGYIEEPTVNEATEEKP